MTVEERRRRRFAETFRREQVGKIQSGELTMQEVSRLYEVKVSSIRLWVKRFGLKEKEVPQIIITNAKDYDRLGSLEKEIEKLKKIIGNQQIEIINQSAIIKLAEIKLGEGFEKK